MYSAKIAAELNIATQHAAAIITLLEGGATVPFISRYRKEMTGSSDEVIVGAVRDRLQQLQELDKRKDAILKSIEEQEKLTPELEKKIKQAETLSKLEDIYLPYKPKRKTRATMAREKGLEPLSDYLLKQGSGDIEGEALKFINDEKGVEDIETALQGARDIIAEKINEDAEIREPLRNLFWKDGVLTSKVIKSKMEAAAKFRDYFEWSEPISKTPSHRLLAMRRGEKELFLSLDISPEDEDAVHYIDKKYVLGSGEASKQIELAVKDAYKRLLKPSMETDVRIKSKFGADEEAIKVFADNARELLLAAPLGQKRTLAIDPGFRTGCKLVCLDRQGKLLHNEAIFPTPPASKTVESEAIIKHLVQKYDIEAIAIGNGTAGRETETFVRNIKLDSSPMIVVVNESGASIYSASDVAREEFPDYDITVRGAVSIGRRLMDPLAELVKIDPKSIGVGQYQHDVDQGLLKKSLDGVVESSVNKVGVEVNTASKELLSYVSGVGPVIAKNIVDYRNENGAFESRSELKKVPRLGAKVYEQAAGFLRIKGAKNPLDESAVHPERYALVKQMAKDLGCEVKDLVANAGNTQRIKPESYVSTEVGLPTLKDILEELEKPGRDPREKFESFAFADGVTEIKDLREGMKLPGIVTNVTKFGAFVDIGVHQDGLVHISQLADKFVSDPNEVVKVNQQVEVTVTEVDADRKRIGLSMKGAGESAERKPSNRTQSDSKRSDRPAQGRNSSSKHSNSNSNRSSSKQQERKDSNSDENLSMEEKLAMLKGKFGK